MLEFVVGWCHIVLNGLVAGSDSFSAYDAFSSQRIVENGVIICPTGCPNPLGLNGVISNTVPSECEPTKTTSQNINKHRKKKKTDKNEDQHEEMRKMKKTEMVPRPSESRLQQWRRRLTWKAQWSGQEWHLTTCQFSRARLLLLFLWQSHQLNCIHSGNFKICIRLKLRKTRSHCWLS